MHRDHPKGARQGKQPKMHLGAAQLELILTCTFIMTDLAEFCEYVIGSLFSIPSAPGSPAGSSTATFAGHGKEGIDTPPYTPPINQLPLSTQPEPPVLVEFIVSRGFPLRALYALE